MLNEKIYWNISSAYRRSSCSGFDVLFSLPGIRPTNDISTEFEIPSKFSVLWFKMCSTGQNKILHTSRQCYCRDVCKISLWSVEILWIMVYVRLVVRVAANVAYAE